MDNKHTDVMVQMVKELKEVKEVKERLGSKEEKTHLPLFTSALSHPKTQYVSQ